MTIKRILAAGLIVGLPAAAAATPIGGIDFVAGCAPAQPCDTAQRIYTTTMSDGSEVNVRATAWSIGGGGNVSAAALPIYGGGLGVINSGETGANGHHQVDASGAVDFIALQFDRAVAATGATLNAFQIKTGRSWTRDNDALFFIATGSGSWTQTIDFAGLTYVNPILTLNSPSSPAISFNPGLFAGDTLLVLALPSVGQNNEIDAFKLASLSFTAPADVPAPGALGLLGLGVLASGAARRRG